MNSFFFPFSRLVKTTGLNALNTLFQPKNRFLWGVLLLTAHFLIGLYAGFADAATSAPITVYGVWHCGNDGCSWSQKPSMSEFDRNNHWLIDRGDGKPSVNLVVLSFVNPMKLLTNATDTTTLKGIPRGMTPDVIAYFKRRGIRVMLSIGGIAWVKFWNQALEVNPSRLGLNAADAALRLGVGMEIDYEEDVSPRLSGLQAFINAYRSKLPYDAAGLQSAARLTIDLAPGSGWLTAITEKAATDWLNVSHPVLDYANAMVPERQPSSAAAAIAGWREHIDGISGGAAASLRPIAPCKLTGSLYITTGMSPSPECAHFEGSLEDTAGLYVRTAAAQGVGITSGMLGFMFWAAGCPGSQALCTTPPHTCEAGVGEGAARYEIPVPMPALRQR